MPTEICKKENCTGCFACMNICPKEAIHKGEDAYAKTVPVIDSKRCIECGQCVRVCPVNHPPKPHEPIRCYAAWAKDKKTRAGSSSGGIAAGLAEEMIGSGGSVYGTAFNAELDLLHQSADTMEETVRFKGSKYVQSYIGMTFREIREKLNSGRQVLFVGTPCQIAGLRGYLGRDYENLVLVDLICHGTPPIKYLKEYIRAIDRKNRAVHISFRGEKDFCLTLSDGKRDFYRRKSNKDYYFLAFLKGLIYRDNCYTCTYAKAERYSDITIGDFWGLDRLTLKTPYGGKISVVLINTLHGERFWGLCEKTFSYEEREVQEAVEGNAQLKKPSVCHKDRGEFLRRYKEGDFLYAVKTPGIKKEICINTMKSCLAYRAARKIAKKILR